ncbi:MAG: YidC/Oxa1 family insertase periplasmic-domain containing protein, partial [Planctomycetaceae bacterium]|nr:YidC/Oxa1 family insertase periplasmic-domain containing protein [Planctomycetaceae bacterium]
MEQRRFILFVLLSTLFLFGWLKFGPILLPNAFPKPANAKGKQADVAASVKPDDAKTADAAEVVPAVVAAGESADAASADAGAAAQPADRPVLPEFNSPAEVVLGSLDPASGYFLELKLDPQGAGVKSATLNDPRFITADGKNLPLAVVGNDPQPNQQTLDSDIAAIDAQLQSYDKSLRTVVWEVVRQDASSVEFRYPSPDGTLEVRKTYKLNQGDPANRDGDYLGYVVDVALELRNLSDQPRDVKYVLQGPVGLPLENADNTRTFIEIKVGTAEKPGSPVQYTAHTFTKQLEDAQEKNDDTVIDAWRDPLAFVAVDVQYFGALLIPKDAQNVDHDGDQKPDATFAVVKP